MNTRVYQPGENLNEMLTPDQAIATCGRCGRTIVVTLSREYLAEFHYCSDREECELARAAVKGHP